MNKTDSAPPRRKEEHPRAGETTRERTSQRIRELRERIGEDDGIGELMRLGILELVEKALEEEVEDALGRGYYVRSESERRGYRNGHRTGRIATAEGEVE